MSRLSSFESLPSWPALALARFLVGLSSLVGAREPFDVDVDVDAPVAFAPAAEELLDSRAMVPDAMLPVSLNLRRHHPERDARVLKQGRRRIYM